LKKIIHLLDLKLQTEKEPIMKFIFFGPSKEIELLTQGFDKSTYSILDDAEKVIAKAGEGDCLVFINFDFNAEQAKKINDALTPDKIVKRIIYSKSRDLRKEKIPSDEYIMGPLNKASFQNAFGEVMGGKTMSSFTLAPKGLDSDVNKGIQDAFDDAFSDAEPTPQAQATAAPAVEAAPAPAAEKGTSPGGIVDEESNLEFSVGGMDLPAGVQNLEATAGSPEKSPPISTTAPVTSESSGGMSLDDLDESSPSPASEPPATPASAVTSGGMSLDDGSETTPPPADPGGMGDLEIPSLGDELPGLELGGSEDVVAAAPQDQGMDLDAVPPSAPVVPSEPIREEIKTSPKPPATLPDAPSDPSMEFTTVLESEKKVKEDDSQAFKFNLPKEKGGVKKEDNLAAPSKALSETSIIAIQTTPPSSMAADSSVVRLEAIIRALRDEREALLKELAENKESKSRLLGENLNLEATSEELKVELSIIKRKNEEEFHEGAVGKKILKEKLLLEEEKNKRLQKDLEILAQKSNIDIGKIHQKEKELEGQLELLSIDSQNQILSREKKISELKREVDAMGFNMSNLVSREKKLRQEKLEVEEKLNKIMRTMRNSIQFLEEELDGNQKLFKELKK
jgi:hypothetical protein